MFKLRIKYDPNQPRDDAGRWTSGGDWRKGAREITPENPPKPGERFMVYRAGSADTSLTGRNAGDIRGVAVFLENEDEDFRPLFGGKPTHISAFVVTVDEEFGTFSQLRDGSGRGRPGMLVNGGYSIALSFGQTGFTAERVRVAPLSRAQEYLAEIGGEGNSRFSYHGTRAVEAALLKALDETAQKFDPNQPRHPAGSGEGGRWAPAGGSAGAVFEVAPNPNDKALTERWSKLSAKEKEEASREVLARLVPTVAKELGVDGKLVEHVGGWKGKVNPSYTLRMPDGDSAVAASKMLGYALQQDGMMLLSGKKFDGAFESGVVGIDLEGGGSRRASQIYARLNEMKKADGEPLVIGFTMRDGRVEILHDSSYTGLSDRTFAERVDAQLGGRYRVAQTTAWASFQGEEDYLDDSSGLAQRLGDWQRRTGRARTTASEALEEALGRRGREDGQPRYRLHLKFDPNQPRYPKGHPLGGHFAPAGGAAGNGALFDYSQEGDVTFEGYQVVRRGLGRGRLAEFTTEFPNRVGLTMNPETLDQWGGDFLRATRELHETGWLSSDHHNHLVWHEIGHGEHLKKVGFRGYARVYHTKPTPAARETMAKVSRYANTSLLEFVAETYAGLRAGKVYDSDVMGLYTRLREGELL